MSAAAQIPPKKGQLPPEQPTEPDFNQSDAEASGFRVQLTVETGELGNA